MGRDAFTDRARILGCLETLEAAQNELADCCWEGFETHELVAVLDRFEVLARRAPVLDHRIIARLVADGNPGLLGASSLATGLSERLRIGLGVARQRVQAAAELGPRTSLTGARLDPLLPTLAALQAQGLVGAENVEIVRKTWAKIPTLVAEADRARAEADLAVMATQFGPGTLQKLSDHLLAVLDPDGDFNDRERAARRGVSMSRQSADGTSRLSARLSAELRAVLEPIWAKLAAPGMCNPADEHPCVTGNPTEAQILADDRTSAQRQHDALLAALRMALASGELGQLNGLPVTVIITATLAELTAATGCNPELPTERQPTGNGDDEMSTAATEPEPGSHVAPTCPPALTGKALTAGGTVLPMSDFLRMASHAYHYLALFDGQGRPLWLGRAKRLATADQRIVLHARDHGCTRPGCTVSGYRCQAHHLEHDWADNGLTDINTLGLACPADNRMASEQGWMTRLNEHGRVRWDPPPQLEFGQPRTNPYHFIEDLIDYHHQHPQPPPSDHHPPPNHESDDPWADWDEPQPGDPEFEHALDQHRHWLDTLDTDEVPALDPDRDLFTSDDWIRVR